MGFAEVIAGLRADAGLTQAQLAERLYVSRDLVSKWETGARRPDWANVCRLAAIFDVRPEAIMPRSERLTRELAGCFRADGDPAETLNDFLATLSERDRGVFIRRYYYLETFNEIGARFGITAGHARTILTRVKRNLARFEGRKTP